MVSIKRAGNLTQVFATNNVGKEVLIGAQLDGGTPAQRGLRLYDVHDGFAYTSNFKIGCSGDRSYKLADSAADIVRAFKQAGIKAPAVWTLPVIGPGYRFAHWAHRMALASIRRVDQPAHRHQ